MRTPITVMAVSLLVLSSCKVGPNVDETTSNQITFTTSLYNQGGQTKADPQPAKTATLTSLNSEQFGSYVTKHSAATPQPIGTNVYSNVRFDVSASGEAVPEKVLFYPSKTEKLTTYAYYPYQSTVFSNAASIAWSVKSDQTSVESVKASEFLYAKAVGDPGSAATPVVLSFTHSMALLHINLTVPVTFIDEQIDTFLDAALKNVASSCVINLNTPAVSSPSKSISLTPRLIEVANLSAETKQYTYEAVLVPQTIATGTELFNISASFVEASVPKRNFKYNLKDALELNSNTFHTINLQLTDYGKLVLTSATVSDWENASVVGDIGAAGVNNTFCFRLINFNKDYSSSISSAKMVINGETYEFNSSKLKVVSGGKTLTSVDVSLPDNNNKLPQDYPFMVSYAEFFNASSASVVKQGFGTEVSAGGDVLIPWYSYNDINTGGSSVGDWTGGSGSSTEKVPINNDFTFMYCNKDATTALACNSVNKVKLTFSNNATAEMNITMMGNRFAANTTAVVNFKGVVASGNAITLYPYTITKVEFFVGAVSAYSQAVSLQVKDNLGYAIALVK